MAHLRGPYQSITDVSHVYDFARHLGAKGGGGNDTALRLYLGLAGRRGFRDSHFLWRSAERDLECVASRWINSERYPCAVVPESVIVQDDVC